MEPYLFLTIIVILVLIGFIGYELCAWRMQKHVISEKENLTRALAAESNLRAFQENVRVAIYALERVYNKPGSSLESRAGFEVASVLRQAYRNSAWREP
jgi:hypothetical protein